MIRWSLFTMAIALMAAVAFSNGSANATLVVHYKFEGDGTDSAGGDNNGVLNGGTTTSGPNLGGAGTQSLPLDGVDDYVSITGGTSIVPGGSKFTMAGFVNLRRLSHWYGHNGNDLLQQPKWWCRGSPGDAISWQRKRRRLVRRGRPYTAGGWVLAVSGQRAGCAGAGNTSLVLNTTYHFAATVDTTCAGKRRAIVLEWLAGFERAAIRHGLYPSAFRQHRWLFGDRCASGLPGTFASGRIDDVRIYNEVLSAAEIRTLASSVPEPATFALALMGVGLFSVRRRG